MSSFTLVIQLINCWDFIQICYDKKMLSSQWDNDNQHFVYIIVSWYLRGIITRQGFLFSCSCMNRCTCLSLHWFNMTGVDICIDHTYCKESEGYKIAIQILSNSFSSQFYYNGRCKYGTWHDSIQSTWYSTEFECQAENLKWGWPYLKQVLSAQILTN